MDQRLDHRLVRAAWITGLGAVVVAPVLVRLATATGVPLWEQLSIVTGLMALSGMVCAAVLPSRLRSLTRAFGIESVLDVHRRTGAAVGVFVLLHLVCVVVANPAQVTLLDPDLAGPPAHAAVGATAALGLLVVLAVRRRKLSYEVWRWAHVLLAGTVLVLSALHVVRLDQLLQEPAMSAVLYALAAAVLAVLAHRWLWRSLADPSTEFVLREVRFETPTVSTLVLEPRGNRHGLEGWTFAPGQFAWLRLERSVTAQEHPFTIASGAHSDRQVEFTIRHAGDFTREVGRLPPGSPVWVDGPHGSFTSDRPTCDGVVMIAGGVGVTPMMSMIRTAAHRGDHRPHRLVVVAGTPEDLLFREELTVLRGYLDLEVTEVLRRPPEGWTGCSGGIGPELLAAVVTGDGHRPAELDWFLCGPPSLVADALDALDALGVPAGRVHTEQFDFA
jgi:predicted ferric reductase